MEEHTTRHVVIALLGQLARSQRRLQKLTIDTYAYTFDHLTTEDLQAFLDAASPGLKELRLRGFHDHLLHSSLLLALQAANAGVHLDFSD